MQKLLICFGMCAIVGLGVDRGSAATPATSRYEQDGPPTTAHHPSAAEQIIWERSAREAQERDSRIESRRWAGYNPQRPAFLTGPFGGSDVLSIPPWQHIGPYVNPHGVYPYGIWVH